MTRAERVAAIMYARRIAIIRRQLQIQRERMP
jgi:hypothetical protein